VVGLFPQQAAGSHAQKPTHSSNAAFGGGRYDNSSCYGDTGSASRFFYSPKVSKKERGEGNNHPTVKPIALMAYLCCLVTPPGGTVLDPFMGSGSTGIAALQEGFDFIGIEREAEYVGIAESRIEASLKQGGLS
jgi:DNA modification methylase